MGKTSNSGLGIGVGSSPQGSITQSEFDNKVNDLMSSEPKPFDSSNFDYTESEPKYDGYLLDLNHKNGGSKAKFLKDVLGYEKGDGRKLHDAIGKAIDGKIPDSIENTQYGIKHNYKVKLTAKDGSSHIANVTIVVQNDNGKTTWRLITITPDKKNK